MSQTVSLARWLRAGVFAALVASPSPAVAGQAPGRQPADTPAVRLTGAEVRTRLAAGTQSSPPDLSAADLSGLDLTKVDFKQANLTRAILRDAKLAGANLFSCDLTDAVLAGADLTKANLDGTVLRRANLQKANLDGASLFATIIEAADLTGANLSNTRVIGYLRSAKLGGAIMRHANMGADPGNQSMGVMRATFVGADLTGAKLDKADLDGADFTGAIGLDRALGLAEARNRDKAIFDAK